MAMTVEQQIKHEEELAQARKQSDILTKDKMAVNILGGTLGNMTNSKMGVSSGSAMKQNVGMLQRAIQPYIVIKRKQPFYNDDSDLGNVIGLPSNCIVKVENEHGFTRFKEIHLEIEGATHEELNAIESLLKKGVIL